MKPRITHSVIMGLLAVLTVLPSTVPIADASAATSFSVVLAKVTHEMALGGCIDPYPPCPDREDDLSDPQGNDPSAAHLGDMGGCSGPGLHVNIANGNVWTEYHVLSTYGGGEEVFNLTLTYNSLLSNAEAGISSFQACMGRGWRHSLDLGHFELQEITDGSCQDVNEEVCVLGPGEPQCTDEEGPQGGNCDPPINPTPVPIRCLPNCACHKEWVNGVICGQTLSPKRYVFVDGDGRQRVYYEGQGTLDRAPWHDAELLIATESNGKEGDEHFLLRYPDGRRRYFHGGNKRMSREVTARGLTTRFYYDESQNERLVRVVDGYGREIRFEYFENDNRLQYIIHPDDAPGNPVRTELRYHPNNPCLLASIVDPLGRETSFEYEPPYSVDHDDNPDTPARSYYRMTKETLRNGVIFNCSYAPVGQAPNTKDARTITAERPGGAGPEHVLQITCDFFPNHRSTLSFSGAEIHLIDGNLVDTTFARNHWYQLTSRTPGGFVSYATSVTIPIPTLGENPSVGRVTRVNAPMGVTTDYTYKNRGRIDKQTTTVTFQGEADLVYLTQYLYSDDPIFPSGTFESYYANFPALPVRKIQPDGGVWEYRYTDKGEESQSFDPEGLLTEHFYEYYGDTEQVPPGMTLPGRFKQVTRLDRRGYKKVWQYRPDGGLLYEDTYLDPGMGATQFVRIEYDYDQVGRQTMEIIHRGDGTFATTKTEYDLLGRVKKQIENYIEGEPSTDEQSLTTAFDYDFHGLLERVTNPRGAKTRFVYDHQNRLVTTIEDEDGFALATVYELDGNGNVTKMTDPAGHVTEFKEYDVINAFHLVTDAEGYNTRLDRDERGNITAIRRQRAVGGSEELVEERSYDGLRRLKSRQRVAYPTMTYRYDHPMGSGSCGCGGLGSNIPYKVSENANPVAVTFNKLDALGRVRRVLKKLGSGDPNSPQQDGDDAETIYDYDNEGNLRQITGPEGEITKFAHDGAGRIISQTSVPSESEEYVSTFTYDGANNLRSNTQPTGHAMLYEYDGADRLSRVLDDLGEIAVLTRDANGNLTSRTDGEGNKWEYVYDQLDRMTQLIDPLKETPEDRTITMEYDVIGNLVFQTNRNGIKTKYDYDRLNRVTKVTEDFVPIIETGDGGIELLDGSGEGGVQGQGVLLGGGTGGGVQTGFQQVSTPTKNTMTTYIYDGRSLIEIRDHNGNATKYRYYPPSSTYAGLLQEIEYPDHNTSSTGIVTFQPDWANRQLIRIDQRDHEMWYEFDELGRLISRLNVRFGADLRRDEYFYDRSSRLAAAVGYVDADEDPYNGPETAYTAFERQYDMLGRPVAETQYFDAGPGGTPAAELYVTSIDYTIDPNAHTLTMDMCYPACGTRLVQRVWDGRGRMVSVNAGATTGIDWQFDDADRRSIGQRRHAGGNLSYLGYDENDRMTSVAHWTGPTSPGTPAFNVNYGYDPEGNRRWTENLLVPDRSERYGHDNRNRLTLMERGVLQIDQGTAAISPFIDHPTLAAKQDWANLDRRGNWLKFLEAHSVGQPNAASREEKRVANGANEYTSLDADGPSQGSPCTIGCLAPVSPAYDKAGNLIFDPLAKLAGHAGTECGTGIPPCGPGLEYEYDGENRLVRIRKDTNDAQGLPDGQGGQTPIAEQNVQMEFVYDALGRRVETIEYVDAATGQVRDGQGGNPPPRRIRHVYFGLEVIQEYACADNWPCGSTLPLAREFLWGDPERYPEPVAMIRHRFDPVVTETYHYLHDVLGSVVGLVNEAGSLVERYTYDPYGKVFIEKWNAQASTWQASAEPASGLPFSPTGNPFMWTGHRYDSAVGLYHTLFRFYDPALGRWLQRDPIGYADSINLYEYGLSGALRWIDPFGLDTVGVYDRNDTGSRDKKDSKKGRPGAGGADDQEEAADDYDHALGVDGPKDLADQLKKLKDEGVPIDEIHIFDHGGPGYQECGDEWLNPNSDEWKKISETVEKDGKVCLHGCKVADKGDSPTLNGEDYLQELADKGNVTVEGNTGDTILLPPIPGVHDHIDLGDTVTKHPKSGGWGGAGGDW